MLIRRISYEKRKNNINYLKIIAIVILLYGVWRFYDWHLWEPGYPTKEPTWSTTKVFLPILTLGFSGTLYGIATLLNKDK